MAEQQPAKKTVADDSGDPAVDEFEHLNYDDRVVAGGHGGKCRSKKEGEQHTNHHDPGGHTRKTTQKLINSHEKEKEQNKAKHN